MSAQPLLRLDGIRVGYPAQRGGVNVVVDGLSLDLQAGEIGCLLGASGCGKTTVLRAIAGFEPLLAGRMELQGERIADAHGGKPAEQRRVGLMFQDYALFPHLDVAANVGFGLRRGPRAERDARVGELLALVDLAGSANAFPHELSGGQQQRVALARALAPEPALLLLDEPFSNLDIDTRQRLAGELRALLKSTGTTVLMVTHDQSEAFVMADRIGVMQRGRILQWDRAEALYRRPADRFVADFIGRGTLVAAASLGLAEGGDVLLRPDGHVAWVGEGGDVFYTRSADGGHTWSPRAVAVEAEHVRGGHPALIPSGRSVHLAVLRARGVSIWSPADSGDSWEGPTHHLGGERSGAGSHTALRCFGERCFLTFFDSTPRNHTADSSPLASGRLTLRIARSEDGGMSWSQAAAALTLDELPSRPLALAADGNDVFIAWESSEATRGARGIGGNPPRTISTARSADGGATWGQPQDLPAEAWYDPELGVERGGVASHPVLATGPDGVYLLYSLPYARPLLGLLRWGEDDEWEVLGGLQEFPELRSPASVTATPTGLLLVWHDGRYRREPWYSTLAEFVGQNVRGKNSDVFAREVGVRGGSVVAGQELVLTPDLALVRNGGGQVDRRGIRIIPVPTEARTVEADRPVAYVFWSGKWRADRSEDSFGQPDELFFTPIDPRDS